MSEPGREQVQTRNLSFSYLSLKPKDKREVALFEKFKADDVSELYTFYIIVSLLIPIQEATQL